MLNCKLQVRLSKKQEEENKATRKALQRAADASEKASKSSEQLRRDAMIEKSFSVIKSLGPQVLDSRDR